MKKPTSRKKPNPKRPLDSPGPQPFHATAEDIAVSIKTMNDPKVRAAFNNDWNAIWNRFRSDLNCKRWWQERCKSSEATYILPYEFIDSLARQIIPVKSAASRRDRTAKRVVESRPLLKKEDADAERAFTDSCQKFNLSCVGVWEESPVVYELLGPNTNYDAFPDALLMSATFLKGTLEQRKAKLRQFDLIGTRTQRIIRQRAGQLFADSQFVKELLELKDAWRNLPAIIPFPLSRRVIDQVIPDQIEQPIPERTIKFFAAVKTFLDRWELTALATWELINPLGPIAGLPARVNLNALGDVLVGEVYPQYWPATGKENAIARLISLAPTGLKPIEERLLDDIPSIYERAYEMRIVEHAFISRYSPAPRGYVARLIEAFAKRFDVGSLRINQIRAIYFSNLPPPQPSFIE